MDFVAETLVFVTLSGSRAYGLQTEMSDTDIRGICVPPPEVESHLFQRFEQAINHDCIEQRYGALRNVRNPKLESTLYSLSKFFKLAAQVNPNIIEILFSDNSFLYVHDEFQELIAKRKMFISKRAKFTFTGYAVAQLGKINRHRKWILNPVLEKPKRSDFGLPETKFNLIDSVEKYIRQTVDGWDFSQFGLDDLQRNELKEKCWEVIGYVVNKDITWDNWPQEYWDAALKKFVNEMNLSNDVTALLIREKDYRVACNHYESYLTWLKTRNPERKVLEEKFKMDTKHAAHLVRLLRMGYEILTEGKVVVNRPDREELLAIRNGAWSYEKLIEYAEEMQKKIDESYKTSSLPRSVDYDDLNKLYHRLYSMYWYD